MRIRYDAYVYDKTGVLVKKRRFKVRDLALSWAGDRLKRRRSIKVDQVALPDLPPEEEEFKPKIVGWGVSGLSPDPVFGDLGPTQKTTTHYAASPRAEDLQEGIALAKSFDRFHRSEGWGGLSYHYLIPDSGELILGRKVRHKGAHVLNNNTGNVGINFYCTLGHSPTAKQRRTYKWLLANAHTDALPQSHRAEKDLRRTDIRGHKQWPGMTTSCPGRFTPENLSK